MGRQTSKGNLRGRKEIRLWNNQEFRFYPFQIKRDPLHLNLAQFVQSSENTINAKRSNSNQLIWTSQNLCKKTWFESSPPTKLEPNAVRLSIRTKRGTTVLHNTIKRTFARGARKEPVIGWPEIVKISTHTCSLPPAEFEILAVTSTLTAYLTHTNLSTLR